MSNLELVQTTYHVVRNVDGKVLLTTTDLFAATQEMIDRSVCSMSCHIDTSTWHREIPDVQQ